MLCISSSRWPLVVSSGPHGALPGPLWLWLSSGAAFMVLVWDFVIVVSVVRGENADGVGIVPGYREHLRRHARPCAGHPRLRGASVEKDVDGRDEARP